MLAPANQRPAVPLDMLRSNEQAQVVELTGNQQQVHRLAEMGLRVGCMIRMVRPGSPCVLSLGGKRLSLRLSPDTDIFVCPAAP